VMVEPDSIEYPVWRRVVPFFSTLKTHPYPILLAHTCYGHNKSVFSFRPVECCSSAYDRPSHIEISVGKISIFHKKNL
jgi:hypothetical protein